MHNKKTAIYNIYKMRERELLISAMRADIWIDIFYKGAKFFIFLIFFPDSSRYQISGYYNF